MFIGLQICEITGLFIETAIGNMVQLHILKLSDKFHAWCYYYLTPHIKVKFGDIHREWFEMLEGEACALAAPRGFAKSHVFSFFYPLYRALEGKEDILLISSKAEYAEKNLIKIRDELEFNTEIISDYGVQKTKVWTQGDIKLPNGSTISARGFEGKIRGIRPSVMIVDDIEDDELVRNDERRRILEKWFREALLPCRAPQNQTLIIGTILHPFSLLNCLINDPLDGWKVKKYVALDEDGKSVWEENWPTHKLERIRDEIGPEAFEQEYQNNPIPDELRKFKQENIVYYEELPKEALYTTTVDPAISLSKSADYTAITTVATDKMGMMYVAETIRKRMLPDEILDELWRTYHKWNPVKIGMETVQYQKMLKYQFDAQCKARGEFPNIVELKLDVSDKGRAKHFRIEALQPLFHNHRVLINKHQKELEIELLSYPGGQHDDLIDSLASHLELVRPFKDKFKRVTYPKNTFGRFWQERKARANKSRNEIKWHV